MGADLGQDLVAQIAEQVPAVADLHRVRQCPPDRLGVRGRSVPAHDLDPPLPTQPGLQGGGLPVGEHLDALAGLRVDDDRGVAVPAAQGEVVGPGHSWNAGLRRGYAP